MQSKDVSQYQSTIINLTHQFAFGAPGGIGLLIYSLIFKNNQNLLLLCSGVITFIVMILSEIINFFMNI